MERHSIYSPQRHPMPSYFTSIDKSDFISKSPIYAVPNPNPLLNPNPLSLKAELHSLFLSPSLVNNNGSYFSSLHLLIACIPLPLHGPPLNHSYPLSPLNTSSKRPCGSAIAPMNVWKGCGPQLGLAGYSDARPRTGESLTISGRPLWERGQVSSYRASSSEASSGCSEVDAEELEMGGEGSAASVSQDWESWFVLLSLRAREVGSGFERCGDLERGRGEA